MKPTKTKPIYLISLAGVLWALIFAAPALASTDDKFQQLVDKIDQVRSTDPELADMMDQELRAAVRRGEIVLPQGDRRDSYHNDDYEGHDEGDDDEDYYEEDADDDHEGYVDHDREDADDDHDEDSSDDRSGDRYESHDSDDRSSDDRYEDRSDDRHEDRDDARDEDHDDDHEDDDDKS